MTRRFVALSALFLLVSVPAVLAVGCGGGDGGSTDLDVGPGDAGDDGTIGDGTSGDTGFVLDTGSACAVGSACGDAGGVCVAGGVCCDGPRACGDVCCPSANLCSFGRCVTPGALCTDATECKPGEICDYAAGPGPSGDAGSADVGETGGRCTGGVPLPKGRCLPKPPTCATPSGDAGVDATSDAGGDGGGAGVTCLDKCEYRPKSGAFLPTVKFSWGKPDAPSTRDSVMMTPIVIELDDDDCDGVVTERDIPEIVFTSFTAGDYTHEGTLHAISIVGGKVVEKFTVAPAADGATAPNAHLAAGNVDGKPGNEIVTCTITAPGVTPAVARVRLLDAAGKVLWTSDPVGACRAPAIADLDQDGHPEIVVETNVLEGATGKILASLAGGSSMITVADVTGDGRPEVVSASRIWDLKGTVLADAEAATVTGGGIAGGSFNAVGDFDRDGKPEIVTADTAHHALTVWRYDAAAPGKVVVIRRSIDINGPLSPSLCPTGSAGNTRGGGPPTIADFNGDGTPDVALAGGVGYAVFDGKKLMDPTVTDAKTVLWEKQTHDCSSAATGSSVFDFEGDGKAEVVYSDEYHLRVYSGIDGTVLFQTCNTTGTLSEYPVIADVDNDGHADIVVASNSYSPITCVDDGSKQAGVRIFGDTVGKWVRTRRVWNEHMYHVTNVGEDGTIPKIELDNWTQPGLDDFRQNVQPSGQFAAPDLVVELRPACEGLYGLVARVRNLGEAAVEAPVAVGFYQGTTKLGAGATTRTLYPAEAEDVFLPLTTPPTGLVTAVVDDGSPPHAWHECRTDNDTSAAVSARCGGVK